MKPTGPIARYYNFLLGVKRFPLKHGAANFACGAGMPLLPSSCIKIVRA